jgi:Fic family protein
MKVPMRPESIADLAKRVDISAKYPELMKVSPCPNGKYLHWDELRHRTPPADLTIDEWWLGVKFARGHLMKALPLRDSAGLPFVYSVPDPAQRLLHEITRDATGGLQMEKHVTSPGTRDRYVVSSLIEESITSSQLEGASTTTAVAKDMLRSGRKPTTKSEQMIFNTFLAMAYVQEHRHDPITPDRIFELHRIVTQDTLDDPSDAGRFRTPEDNVVVQDPYGNILFTPPPAEQLAQRLEILCEFAASEADDIFLHPVVKAILIHFWLAFDHPFVDGNGRTARALYYWHLLQQGYWLAEFISISRILRKAPAQYARAFLLTETDDNDATYFVLHQLRVLGNAIHDLKLFLRRKVEEVKRVEKRLRETDDINHRQLALLSHALKHPEHGYTIQSHQTSHRVVYETARSDLLKLKAMGLLQQRRRGRAYIFYAPADLEQRLDAYAASDA